MPAAPPPIGAVKFAEPRTTRTTHHGDRSHACEERRGTIVADARKLLREVALRARGARQRDASPGRCCSAEMRGPYIAARDPVSGDLYGFRVALLGLQAACKP